MHFRNSLARSRSPPKEPTARKSDYWKLMTHDRNLCAVTRLSPTGPLPKRRTRRIRYLGCFTQTLGSNVNDGDDRPVNFVLWRAVGKDSQLIPSTLPVRKLPFDRPGAGHDLQNQR